MDGANDSGGAALDVWPGLSVFRGVVMPYSYFSTANSVFDLKHLSRYFFECSSQAMVAVEGGTYVIRHANPAFLRLAGVHQSDLIGRPFADAVPEGSTNQCISLLERVYRTGEPKSLAEQEHGNDASTYWSYAAWVILGADDQHAGVMMQINDSTEIARFRRQAAQTNEALLLAGIRQHELAEQSRALSVNLQAAVKGKEYFIAVLSHELRTPLTPVLIAASLMLQDPRLERDTREIMQMIHRNVTLEARLIDDLLETTRFEAGKLTLDRHPTDLRIVVQRALETCNADIAAGGFQLDVNIGHDLQAIDGDAGRLQQVFANLLSNAIKFTPARGRIRVRCYCDDGTCAVEVSDNGIGIEPEFLPRAFNSFEQENKTHARKQGLGLGLAICKTIVELHGGAISVRSPGKDQGTTFLVRLPTLAGVHQILPEVEPVSSVEPLPIKPLRILLVEDHADTARMMSRLLKLDGHAVQWASDVAAGLKLAADREFDLLLSDLGLPDGTGVDLMRALRQRGSTLPGIVLSGYGQDEDLERSREAGFVNHLIKPVNLETLREAIVAIADQVQ